MPPGGDPALEPALNAAPQISPLSGARRPRQEGFTLVELVLVVAVLVIAAGMALPRLPDVAGLSLEREGGRVERLIRVVRTRAVSLSRYYRLELDLEEHTIRAEYFGPEGLFIVDDEVRTLVLPDSVAIVDVWNRGQGKVVEGRARLGISPRGYVEPSIIHLADHREKILSVIPAVLSGQVSVVEGYVEPENG